jgi:hypothetical protein
MTKAPETFPKQPVLRPLRDGSPGFGNWLRLPGKHHSHDHWSRVWDGRAWLDGAAAVAHVLSLTGDRPEMVPDVPLPPPPPPPSPRHHARYIAEGNLSAAIAGYMRRVPNLAAGQGRDDKAFQFAAWLVRDMALDDATALAWLERWDGGNSPPKGRAALEEILANAHRHGRRPVGCGRPPEGPRRDRHGHVLVIRRTEVG